MMIVRLFMLIALIASSQDSSAASEKWINESRSILAQAKADRSKESVLVLIDRIRSLGRLLNENDIAELELQRDLINGAVSIPGHAQYIADLVRSEQTETQKPGSSLAKSNYDRDRAWYISGTLRYLPSPETVRVLGEFLSDDLDKPGPPRPHQDWIDYPANSVMAVTSLAAIGLRNPPQTGDKRGEEALVPWREWWAKVKSGEQAFSFEKQEVEYVFQKDGSVTSRPRNGAPRPRNAPVIASPVVPAAPSVTWPYWLSGGLVAVAAVWWLLARRSRERLQKHPE